MPLRRPIRLNPTRIIYRKLVEADTIIDPDFRESVGTKHFAAEQELTGQINIFSGRNKFMQMHRTENGNEEAILGRITFRKKDLEDLGVSIGIGDKIVRYGELGDETDVNGRIIHVRGLASRLRTALTIEAEFVHDYDKKIGIRAR